MEAMPGISNRCGFASVLSISGTPFEVKTGFWIPQILINGWKRLSARAHATAGAGLQFFTLAVSLITNLELPRLPTVQKARQQIGAQLDRYSPEP